MWVMSLSLVTAGLAAIISAVSGTQNLLYRTLLIIFAVAGIFFGLKGASDANQEQLNLRLQIEKQIVSVEQQTKLLEEQRKRLEELKAVLSLVNNIVGDLGTLEKMTGGAKYYVRIAADTDRDRLLPYLERLEQQFKGARASNMVAIRNPRAGSKLYELVFGQSLTVTAAEVFQRLAMSHHLPPPRDVAVIVPE